MWPFSKSKQKKQGKFFTREQVRTIFKNAFGQDCLVFADDGGYYAIPINDFMALARQRPTDPWYSKDLYDCNRFARGFYTDISRIWADKTWGNWPLAFAFVKVKRPNPPNHALILQIDDKGIIHFIEPQTDTVLPKGDMIPYFIEA